MARVTIHDIRIRSTILYDGNSIVQEIDGVQYTETQNSVLGHSKSTLVRDIGRSHRVIDVTDKNNFRTVSCKKSIRLTDDFIKSLDEFYKCFVNKPTRDLLLTLRRSGTIQDYMNEIQHGISDTKVVATSFGGYSFNNNQGICLSFHESSRYGGDFTALISEVYDTCLVSKDSLKLQIWLHYPCKRHFKRKDCEVYTQILKSFSNSFVGNLDKAKRIALFS